LLFNADGSHWLLSGGNPKKPTDTFLIVDGRTRATAVIAPDSHPTANTSCPHARKGPPTVLSDGKPLLTVKTSHIDGSKSVRREMCLASSGVDQKVSLYLNASKSQVGRRACGRNVF